MHIRCILISYDILGISFLFRISMVTFLKASWYRNWDSSSSFSCCISLLFFAHSFCISNCFAGVRWLALQWPRFNVGNQSTFIASKVLQTFQIWSGGNKFDISLTLWYLYLPLKQLPKIRPFFLLTTLTHIHSNPLSQLGFYKRKFLCLCLTASSNLSPCK